MRSSYFLWCLVGRRASVSGASITKSGMRPSSKNHGLAHPSRLLVSLSLSSPLSPSLSLCRQSLHQSSSTPGAGACVKARLCWEQELLSKLVRALSQQHTVVGLEQCLSGDVLVCWWDVVGTMTGMAWMVTPGSHR
jgi:hypothetical protein